MEKSVFTCTMCGQCCEGQGGIVVSPSDLIRLCDFLQIDHSCFNEQYAYVHNNKLKIKSGADNFCIFFKKNIGCTIHIARPDICRAWPFFRGNMVDSESFYLAKDYCPGIDPESSHSDFVAEGLIYLKEHSLGAYDIKCEAHALVSMNTKIADLYLAIERK